MKTGAPTGNQNARNAFKTAPQRRRKFTPELWGIWYAQRFAPSDKEKAQQEALSKGIEEFRNVWR